MIRVVRDVYDYVIVDTPPLGLIIDSAIIADSCDGSVIVVESGTISYRFVQEVRDQLAKSNCPDPGNHPEQGGLQQGRQLRSLWQVW